MTVEFRCKSPKQNRLTISNLELPNGTMGSVYFDKGIYTTTDKDMVGRIMQTEAFRRGTILLHTPETDVSNWLENDEEPSYITKEWVDSLSVSAVIAIGKLAGVNSKAPGLIRLELVGLPLTTKLQDIAAAFAEEEARPTAKEVQAAQAESLADVDEVDILIQNGVINREGPWYKDVQTGKNIGRNKESVLEWLKSKE